MRVALHTKVRADRIDRYEAAHREVPVELTDAIRPPAPLPGRSGAAVPTSSTSWTARTTAASSPS